MITVKGISGVFLYANEPQKLAEWYALHFGMAFLSDVPDTYYMEFFFRDDTSISTRRSTVFAIMKAQHPLSLERGKYLINYRVEDLRDLVEQLQAKGVVVGSLEELHDGRSSESKGLFTRITDPEGNHLELYQPI